MVTGGKAGDRGLGHVQAFGHSKCHTIVMTALS